MHVKELVVERIIVKFKTRISTVNERQDLWTSIEWIDCIKEEHYDKGINIKEFEVECGTEILWRVIIFVARCHQRN